METKVIVKQSRWQSKYLWTALATQVISILLLTGVIDVGQSELATQVVGMLLQIGTIVGVLNNPSDAQDW